MKGMPNNGQGWNANPWDYWLSPELRYANVSFKQTGRYYIWVCGLGGTVNDDSLHMGRDDYPYDTSREITGYASAAWQWQSIKMNGARPYLCLLYTSDAADERFSVDLGGARILKKNKKGQQKKDNRE